RLRVSAPPRPAGTPPTSPPRIARRRSAGSGVSSRATHDRRPRTPPPHLLGLVVEALDGELLALLAPYLDLEIELVREALHGIDGDHGEALIGDGRLVDHLRLELRGGTLRAAEHGRV